MKQPPSPNSLPQSQQSNQNPSTKNNNNSQKKKVPTPQELISHYKTKGGLDQEQASIKVIEDLQNVLLRVVASNNKNNKKDRIFADTSKKIDVLNSRLAIVDMKLDSKPGYPETFAIGVASGAALSGIRSVWPFLKGFAQIWNTVRNPTSNS